MEGCLANLKSEYRLYSAIHHHTTNVFFFISIELSDVLEKEHHITPTVLITLGRVIEKSR